MMYYPDNNRAKHRSLNKLRKINVIQVYVPAADKGDTKLKVFMNNLKKLKTATHSIYIRKLRELQEEEERNQKAPWKTKTTILS